MSDLKTIAVQSKTKRVLIYMKQHPRETFDDVIRKLIPTGLLREADEREDVEREARAGEVKP